MTTSPTLDVDRVRRTAYEAAVTVTIPDPENTPGALYL